MTNSPNTFSRLRIASQSQSDLEKKVTQFLIEQPEVILKSTLAKVAQECNVSDTTVLRVCREAGFEGFSELKISLARDLSSPLREIGEEICEDDNSVTIFQKVFQANIHALYDTLEIMEKTQLEHAIELLDDARHILIIGVGTSGVIAEDLYSKLIRLKKSCSFQTDLYNQLIEASLLDEHSLLVCISLSGKSTDPLETIKVAQSKKAKTLCITGDNTSPLAICSDAVLSVVFRQPWIESMASRVAEYTLLEVLYVILSIRHLQSSLDNEKSINQALANKQL